jgi:hypothetical protein
MVQKSGRFSRQFIRYATQDFSDYTLKQYIVDFRRKNYEGYECLSRKKKKRILGTIHNPSSYVRQAFKKLIFSAIIFEMSL